jgi:hypothetical protein
MDTILCGLGSSRAKCTRSYFLLQFFISLIDHFALLRENVTALTLFSTGEKCR